MSSLWHFALFFYTLDNYLIHSPSVLPTPNLFVHIFATNMFTISTRNANNLGSYLSYPINAMPLLALISLVFVQDVAHGDSDYNRIG